MKTNFKNLVPVERNLILVASDEKYTALTEKIPFKKILNLLPIFLLPYNFLIPLIIFSLDEFKKILRRGDLPIPHLSPREAVNRFRFDHGHPIDGAVYIADPVLENRYLLPAVANERLAQEKVAAFLDLTAALGAKKLRLITAEFLDKKRAAGLDINTEAARIGIDLSRVSNVDNKNKVFREFQRPEKFPLIPERAEKWLDEDPIFRSIANGRINAKVLIDQAQLRAENRFPITSSITLGFEKNSIKAGGELRNVASSVFGFSIEYWPIDG
jgi:hypothetical protein